MESVERRFAAAIYPPKWHIYYDRGTGPGIDTHRQRDRPNAPASRPNNYGLLWKRATAPYTRIHTQYTHRIALISAPRKELRRTMGCHLASRSVSTLGSPPPPPSPIFCAFIHAIRRNCNYSSSAGAHTPVLCVYFP